MKAIALFLAIVCLAMAISGCQRTSPLPPDWYIHPIVEPEEAVPDNNCTVPDNSPPPENTPPDDSPPREPDSDIRYFLDYSMSMERMEDIVPLLAQFCKASAGYNARTFYGMRSGKLAEVNEELILAGLFGNGAPIDLLKNGGSLPVNPNGLNIISTDLQTEGVSPSDFGKWLVNTKSQAFSFYIFPLHYQGNLFFNTNISYETFTEVCVSGVDLAKDFLFIAFGNETLVTQFDARMRELIDDDRFPYDMCHVCAEDIVPADTSDAILQFQADPGFVKNVSGLTSENTNKTFGLKPLEFQDIIFTVPNTFGFTKTSTSTGTSKAVRAVVYAIPAPGQQINEIESQDIHVYEWNKKKGSYEESQVEFDLAVTPYINGFPTLVDGLEKDIQESLTTKIGSSIVSDGPVLAVALSNPSLPSGKYAIETELQFNDAPVQGNLELFGRSHSGGLEEYVKELRTNCSPQIVDGEKSQTLFDFHGDSNTIFSKLLDLEKVTNELVAAGFRIEPESHTLSIRYIIQK